MVRVVTYLIQIIVFTTDAQTFLRIGNTCIFRGRIAQEEVLERVHTRVDKHECRVRFIYHRCRWNDFVALALKEL